MSRVPTSAKNDGLAVSGEAIEKNEQCELSTSDEVRDAQ
jgi:hypothetical protein